MKFIKTKQINPSNIDGQVLRTISGSTIWSDDTSITGQTLSETLSLGNESGGSDIVMSPNDFIKSLSGNSAINLRADGVDSTVSITTNNGLYDKEWLYQGFGSSRLGYNQASVSVYDGISYPGFQPFDLADGKPWVSIQSENISTSGSFMWLMDQNLSLQCYDVAADKYGSIGIRNNHTTNRVTYPQKALPAFLSSQNSTIVSGITNSVILGGNNITADTSDTAYVSYLNINELGSGTPVTNLAIDANGQVVNGSSLTGSTSPFKYNTIEPTAIEPVLGSNSATGFASFIGGGQSNSAGGAGDSIIGGLFNTTLSGASSIIMGGIFNSMTLANSSVIGGGSSNIITGAVNIFDSTIGGGTNNTIDGSSYVFIGGGSGNTITSGSINSTIIGGIGNTVTHPNSHIIGSNITSVSANTVHVERLNINDVGSGALVTNLAIDTNGFVVSGTSVDTFVSGMTFNSGNYDLTINRNDGTSFTESLAILASDMVVTGGTYNINTGVVTFTNNSGSTFNVSGFTSGMTDSYTSSANLNGNVIEFNNNIQGSNLYNVDLTPILSGAVQELNDLSDVSTDLPAISAQTFADDGRLLHYDVNENLWVTDDIVTHGTVVINVYGDTTISKGSPVYLTGNFSNDLHEVGVADADDPTKMPVIGFAAEDLTTSTTNSKHVITFGKLQGVDTTSSGPISGGESWSAGDILYISTTGGTLTTVRPIGPSTQIQRIAQVLRIDSTGGQLFIFNTARSAGLPNLSENKLWVGDTNNQPTESTISEIISTSANCISDLYVSNIHSCSPLLINPLDEGNVYIGSDSGFTYDTLNSRVGIGITSPSSSLHMKGVGATDATTSLLVETSIGTDVLTILDGGDFKVGSGSVGNLRTNPIPFGGAISNVQITATNGGNNNSTLYVENTQSITGSSTQRGVRVNVNGANTNNTCLFLNASNGTNNRAIEINSGEIIQSAEEVKNVFGYNVASHLLGVVSSGLNGNSTQSTIFDALNGFKTGTSYLFRARTYTGAGGVGGTVYGNYNTITTNDATNYGGYFSANGRSSSRRQYGVYGIVNKSASQNHTGTGYGGYFVNNGSSTSSANIMYGVHVETKLGAANMTANTMTTLDVEASTSTGSIVTGDLVGLNVSVITTPNTVQGNTYAALINGGDVGIGTTAPTAKLHVDGSVRFVDGNQSDGYVLTSDANGNATWQSTSGITSGFSSTEKYVISTGFTASVSKIITHNLGTEDVVVDLWEDSPKKRTDGEVEIIDSNNIKVTMASTATFKIVIIG
jgi:hypothetical protein